MERDSKNRKVTSNLGLTFRSSKWSNYTRTNITLSSRTSFLNSLRKVATFLILLIVLSCLISYYSFWPYKNFVNTTLWFIQDADLYLKVLFTSSLLCSVQALVSSLFNKFFLGIATINYSDKKRITSPSNWNLPKEFYKPLLCSWALNSSFKERCEFIFEPNLNKSVGNLNLILFYNLFKATYFINKLQESKLEIRDMVWVLGKNNDKKFNKTLLSPLNSSLFTKNWYALYIDFLTFNNTKTKNSNLDEMFSWLISSLDSDSSLEFLNLQWKQGLFLNTNLSYSSVNDLSSKFTELDSLRTSTNLQISLILQNRWLYKYTVLHRASFLNALHTTLVKQLISAGFYDSSFLTRNIWASSSISYSKLQPSLFGDLTRMLYGDNLTGVNPTLFESFTSLGGINFSNINSLTHYESSYYWFLNRSFALTTLPSTVSKLLPIMHLRYHSTQKNAISSYSAKDLELTTALNYSLLSSQSVNFKKKVSLDAFSSKNRVLSKDFYLKYSDFNLFSKTRLNNFVELNTSFSSSTHTFYSPKSI